MLFRTRKLKGLGGETLSAATIRHLNNKTKFFKKMAKAINPGVVDLASEKKVMKNALLSMADDKKGLRTQAAADQLVRWQYGKKDAFDYGETRKLTRDFKNLGVTTAEMKEARKKYFDELHEIKRKNMSQEKRFGQGVSSGMHNASHAPGSETTRLNGAASAERRDHFLHSGNTPQSGSAHPILSRIRNTLRGQEPPSFPNIPRRPKF